ncbi:MAG: dimethyl sulfoxide reductase anchor subunit [Gammaproteobacteria bacterium]|jgi:DMSO reductase iron-sulfur subunit|nr:dimethyl sulfoxide reductase anchor subunit [Gammaproteobacteria bacterium]
MFRTRDDEPGYALIPRVQAPERNRYGKPLDLVSDDGALAGKSLNINGDDRVYEGPDRYRQHGFYFNADNCIACHACESACSEKNDLPPHLAFRSVGYVEGGTWPAYARLNVSMACNHCDDPVCLKGCPTRAYTKFPEYGAVLQDPDICFGCGYCTWVCPYNAPQLDPVAGHVQKCNMCVDRLEQGLKPACAAACLGGALDFGVIETTPANREQLETSIPGFPDPEITHPNIRFQQTRSLPREMTRPDSVPLSYRRDAPGEGPYHARVRDTGTMRRTGPKGLRSREDPLVVFTLITQAVVGAFLTLFLGPLFGLDALSADAHPVAYPALLFALLGLETFALVLSTLHLGKPHRFYRAFNNLRYSPVSREVASLAVFYNFLGTYTLISTFPMLLDWLPGDWSRGAALLTGWGAAITGPASLYFMHRIYRIAARPFWNHWQVLTAFFGNMFALGPLLAGLSFSVVRYLQGLSWAPVMSILALPVVAGLVLEAIGLIAHGRDLKRRGGEGAAAYHQQVTTFGRIYRLRSLGLCLSVLSTMTLGISAPEGPAGLALWFVSAGLVLATAVGGRALFYVVVMPTTMPGAFFWRNPGFQDHARESGLAHLPQTGIIAETH